MLLTNKRPFSVGAPFTVQLFTSRIIPLALPGDKVLSQYPMAVFHRSLAVASQEAPCVGRGQDTRTLPGLSEALNQALPRNRRTFTLARIYTASRNTTSSRPPGKMEACHGRPGSLPGSSRAWARISGFLVLQPWGRKTRRTSFQEKKRTTPNGTTSNAFGREAALALDEPGTPRHPALPATSEEQRRRGQLHLAGPWLAGTSTVLARQH